MSKEELTIEKEEFQMDKWETFKIGDKKYLELIMGQSPLSKYYNKDGDGLPFFQGKRQFGELYPEPDTWCSKPIRIAEKGDILLSVRAPVGPTNLAEERCCIGRGLAALRVNDEKLITKYILYYLKNFELEIESQGQGSTFKAISAKILRKMTIACPPLSEQHRIVSKLDALFSEIDASLALIDQNIAQAEALKLSVLDEILGELKEKQLLKNITKIIGGGTPKTKINEYWNGDIVWLSPKDLPPIGVISTVSDSSRKITELGLQKSSAKLLPKGTICYSSRASIGKIAIAEVELSTNQGFTNFICNEGIYNRFLAYVLRYSENEIVNLSNSTTFKEVSKTSISNFQVPITDYVNQKEIVQKLDALFAEIDALVLDYTQKRENLEALKSSLLDQAFKGEL